ncbi:hypothetical protein [Duffyella gerundensis]|uniref:hypothetical protein n=1 Tax=Duffyella gerundensis TaxID=1619313 RepID=UPI0021F79758|nr:hypothetical protein [Duffyella gerundensis]
MSIKFNDLIDIYDRVDFTSSFDGGTFLIKEQSDVTLIENVLLDPTRYGITSDDDLVVHSTIHLKIGPPKFSFGQLHKNISSFLSNEKNRYEEPKNYYLLEEKVSNKNSTENDVFKKYRQIIDFITLLKESAVYFDAHTCEIVYLDTDIVKVVVSYSEDDLKDIDSDKIDELFNLFTDDTHRDQKITILGATVKQICSVRTSSSSFSSLINNLDTLVADVKKGYRIFVSGFSYKKIIDQLKAAKVEEIGKIHKTFSDIQNQILGIPIATLVISTQMKEALTWNSQAIINTAIVMGSLVFTILVLLTILNQWQTLNALEDEINYKREQAESLYKAIYEDIRGTFKHLVARIRIQKAAFIFIGVVLGLGLWYTYKIYSLLTPSSFLSIS